MANTCKPCKEDIFKTISSNPDVVELLDQAIAEGGGKNIEVEGDNLAPLSLFIDRVENDESKTFTLRYSPYTPLTVNLVSDKNSLLLKGSNVGTFNLNWTFNKSVDTQTLSGGLVTPTTPAVVSGQTSYSVTGGDANMLIDTEGFQKNTSFTISADDDIEDNRGSKSDSTSITFGNYVYWGKAASNGFGFIDASFIQNNINVSSFNKQIRTNPFFSFTSSSQAGENDIVLVPSNNDLTSGQQFIYNNGNNKGGFVTTGSVDITNSAGYEESYDIWVSLNQGIGLLGGVTFQIQ